MSETRLSTPFNKILATPLQCYHFRMSKHDSFRNLFSPTTAPLPMAFKRPTSAVPSLAPWALWCQEAEMPELAFSLIEAPHPQEVNYLAGKEAPHPQEVNYLAGKEAPSSVLINYLWRCNYSETSLIRPSKMRTPPSTGHHQESSCFCFVCFCQINLGGASGLVACACMAIITLYSVLH